MRDAKSDAEPGACTITFSNQKMQASLFDAASIHTRCLVPFIEIKTIPAETVRLQRSRRAKLRRCFPHSTHTVRSPNAIARARARSRMQNDLRDNGRNYRNGMDLWWCNQLRIEENERTKFIVANCAAKRRKKEKKKTGDESNKYGGNQ